MILPGNARQVIVDALGGFTEAPLLAGSKIVNDLEDAGFRVVDHGELTMVLQNLLSLIAVLDPAGKTDLSDGVVLAKALIEVMRP